MTYQGDRVAGRLCVTVDTLAQSARNAVASEQVLAAFDGITKVDFSAATGSVTVYYDRDIISLDHVFLLLASVGLVPWKRATRYLLPRQSGARDS